MNLESEYSLDDTLRFGKYKGMTVREAIDKDHNYINWCVDNIPKFELDIHADNYLDEVIDKVVNKKLGGK